MKKLSLALLALVVALAMAPAAKADTFYFNFGGAGVLGTGSLTGNSLGGGLFNITGGSITINGLSATIVGNATPGNVNVSTDGEIFFDNVLNTNGGPALNNPNAAGGMFFLLSNGGELEVWYANGTYMYDEFLNGQWLVNGENGEPVTFDVSDSPEPSSIFLLGTGLLLLALVMRMSPLRLRLSAPKSMVTRALMVLFALACFAGSIAKAESAAPRRVTQAIDETRFVTLTGHVIPVANRQTDRGPVEDNLGLDHIQLVLKRSPEQEQELNKLMDEQNDRKSPNFHHWLTAEEFGARFGVAQEDVDAVTGWLESHGFHVNKVYTNRMVIDFSGTAGQLREAFHTPIHHIDVKGEPHMANMGNPRIPEALAPVVLGIASLHDIKPKPMYEPVTQYTFAGCSGVTGPGSCYGITPQDNQTIYGLNPLYASGITGAGQTIYLVEDTNTYGTDPGGTSDWQKYVSTFGLSGYGGTYTQVHPGGCTNPGTNGDDGEAAIDVEVATGIAPSASIQLISCAGSTFTFGGQVALQNLINETSPAATVGVVSVSYGLCEAITGQGGNALFSSTYQQAAAMGFSVFVSSGDDGPSSCSDLFNTPGYEVTSLGVTGWGETAYNVSVGGTDFEDTYNSKKANAAEGGSTIPMSTYWNAANSPSFGSAKSYIPEIPWNDACASALISEVLTNSFTPYGASPATCNNASYDTASTFLSTGAGSGGASNCAIGAAGTNQSSFVISAPECQGYAKPSWQSGTSLPGGVAVYGVPSDGVRDIPDVAMFAANGVWGHYEVVCWSDPSQSSGGATSCAGAPSTWAGFGGTSVASPTMAAVQALVNQKTGESWGNPNPMYYQIAQAEYGTAGGSFLGSACNSSGAGGPASSCAFNDITQGDIDLACENNGATQESHCYKPAGVHGVDSTDNVTAATVINGGSGYTSAPACAIAGPTNISPYLSPTGSTLWAGGTQATCTAAVNIGTTTAVWTIAISAASAAGQQITVGPNTYTLAGANTTAIATALKNSINTGSVATATSATKTVTATAKVAGYAGNFNVSWANGFYLGPNYVVITNTALGQGPNYVSGIAIATAGKGYQPETPITLTGVGSGAIAVANTSIGTAAQSYQPAYGAAPGYDLATGLGSPNANALVNNAAWLKSQSITWSQQGPYTYGQSPVALTATASSGLAVSYTYVSGPGVLSGLNNSTLTITGAGSIVINANQAGNGAYSAASQVQQTIVVGKAPLGVTVNANSFIYGGSPSVPYSGTVSGLVNGDTSNLKGVVHPAAIRQIHPVNDITVTYSLNPAIATASSGVGVYPNAITATVTGSASGNYSVTVTPATLTISKAPLTVTVNPSSFTFGGALPTFTGSAATLVNGDTVGTTITIAYSTAVLSNANAGTYTNAITATVGGASLGNYSVTVDPGTLTIGKATLTVTCSAASFVQGGPLPYFPVTVTGIVIPVNNPGPAVVHPDIPTGISSICGLNTTLYPGLNANSAPGGYPNGISPTVTGAPLINYTVDPIDGNLTITNSCGATDKGKNRKNCAG